MAIERYPFLVDLAFVMVGLYFATLHVLHPQPTPSVKPETHQSATADYGSVDIIPAASAPKNGIRISVMDGNGEVSYSLDGAVISDDGELMKRLSVMHEKDAARPVLIKTSSLSNTANLREAAARVNDVCKKVGLKAYMLMESK